MPTFFFQVLEKKTYIYIYIYIYICIYLIFHHELGMILFCSCNFLRFSFFITKYKTNKILKNLNSINTIPNFHGFFYNK